MRPQWPRSPGRRPCSRCYRGSVPWEAAPVLQVSFSEDSVSVGSVVAMAPPGWLWGCVTACSDYEHWPGDWGCCYGNRHVMTAVIGASGCPGPRPPPGDALAHAQLLLASASCPPRDAPREITYVTYRDLLITLRHTAPRDAPREITYVIYRDLLITLRHTAPRDAPG